MAVKREVSPKGVGRFVMIDKPSTKFKEDGDYIVKLALPASSKEAKAFMKKIDSWMEECWEVHDSKRKADPPYMEDGNEIVFAFKQNGVFRSKKDKSTRKVTINVVDSKLSPIKVNVGAGSELKVSFRPSYYKSPGGDGVKMYMDAVQVLNLVEYVPQSELGFSEEEGFEASEEEITNGFKEEDGYEADTEDEEDF